DHAAIAAEELRARGLDTEHALDTIEVGRELVGAELVKAELALPVAQHAIWRAVARTRVDRCRAADGLAERDRDADIADRERRGAASVQLLLHRKRPARELRAIEVVTFLDEHDGEPGLGELAPDHGAARAGADHDDVALDREVTA